MRAIPFSVVEGTIQKYGPEIRRYSAELKAKLQKLSVNRSLSRPQRRYINKLIKVSEKIIIVKPSLLNRYKKIFERIVPPVRMKSPANKKFCSALLKTLGYSRRRNDFYPLYFRDIGIRACIYCNSMPTISVEKNKVKKTNRPQARFQVDHYLPKSEYPCFSISLYNLYPACASCNNSKGIKKVHLKLYEEDKRIEPSGFYFMLDMDTVAEYILGRDRNSISYTFSEPGKKRPGTERFNDVFAINGIYETQKDIAEELVLKAEIYTRTYRNTLVKEFPQILNSADITNRLILGNYAAEEDMHKRPMAKFMIDIAKQVGLI